MEENPIHPTTETVTPHAQTRSGVIKPAVAGGIIVGVLVLGSLTGFMLANLSAPGGTLQTSDSTVVAVEQSDTKAGIIDKKTFSDTATGVLREGGFEGEGSYHLERGAKDQTAYLTSSTADLSTYVGKKVQVWGQTYAGEKTGWLMDVGYIEVVK